MNGTVELKDIYESINEFKQDFISLNSSVDNLNISLGEIKVDIRELKDGQNQDKMKAALLEQKVNSEFDNCKLKFGIVDRLSKQTDENKNCMADIKSTLDKTEKRGMFWTEKAILISMTILASLVSIGIALMK